MCRWRCRWAGLLAMLVGLGLGMAGCAVPRQITRLPDEGVIALPNNSDDWPTYHRTNALKLIEAHVGPHYEIIEEKEVTVGYTTTQNQDTVSEPTFGVIPFLPAERQTTRTTSVSTPEREWHIYYRRRQPEGGARSGIPGNNSAQPVVQTTRTKYEEFR